MNTLDIINSQLDDIELARLDSKERMLKGQARRHILQKAFNSAGVVNWNFVEADLYLDDLDPTEAELSMMVSRWEQKEMVRLGIK